MQSNAHRPTATVIQRHGRRCIGPPPVPAALQDHKHTEPKKTASGTRCSGKVERSTGDGQEVPSIDSPAEDNSFLYDISSDQSPEPTNRVVDCDLAEPSGMGRRKRTWESSDEENEGCKRRRHKGEERMFS